MNQERKQFLVWTTIAEVLFILVGVHDILYIVTIHMSELTIQLEIVAGACFLLSSAS